MLEEGPFTSVFGPLLYTVLRDIILLRKKELRHQELDAYQLPPVSALRNHLLRTRFVIRYWFGSVESEVERLDVTQFGFDEEGAPVQCSSSDADLWGVDFVICQCKETKKGDRCARRCPCKERGECSSLCGSCHSQSLHLPSLARSMSSLARGVFAAARGRDASTHGKYLKVVVCVVVLVAALRCRRRKRRKSYQHRFASFCFAAPVLIYP